MIHTKSVNAYLKENGLNPDSGYLLKDDGSGAKIVIWDLDIPRPQSGDLNAFWEDAQEKGIISRKKERRREAYPPVGDQLDAILKWIKLKQQDGEQLPVELSNIITEWDAVKVKYKLD